MVLFIIHTLPRTSLVCHTPGTGLSVYGVEASAPFSSIATTGAQTMMSRCSVLAILPLPALAPPTVVDVAPLGCPAIVLRRPRRCSIRDAPFTPLQVI